MKNVFIFRSILIVTTIIVLIGILSLILGGPSRQKLTIKVNYSSPIKVQVFEINYNDQDWINANKPVAETATTKTISLKKGNYGLLINKTVDTNQQTTTLKLDKEPITITINPIYTEEKLYNLLEEQKSVIRDNVKQAFPMIQNGYYFDGEKLINQGEWYVARVINDNQADIYGYADNYIVVMKKNGDGSWVKAIDKPTLLVDKANNRSIPDNVIKAANSYYN